MWNGQIVYVTGGTTATPKKIAYDWKRFDRSVRWKHKLFEVYGVDQASRVAVCHPFSPWAIGNIFVEGALRCGASVLPLGLNAQNEPFRSMLDDFMPTHVCAAARNLVSWRGLDVDQARPGAVAFVAGEKLQEGDRRSVAKRWGGPVVDVYGLAEFDMVGAELPGVAGLSLVPEFTYGIRQSDAAAVQSLAPGIQGELMISETVGDWFATGDNVRVSGRAVSWPCCSNSWQVEFLERIDGAVTFSDGSMLCDAHIQRVLAYSTDLTHLQAVVVRTGPKDRIELLCVLRSDADTTTAVLDRIRDRLLETAVDVRDSLSFGVIESVAAVQVTEAQMVRTARGKIPSVIVKGDQNASE